MTTRVITGKRGHVAVIEDEVDIERSPEEVFDYCSDHTRELEWNIKMKRVQKLTDGPVGLGTRYEMEFIPGHPVVAECVRFERPTAWDLVGEMKGARFGWRGRVQATKDGAHLMVRMEIAPHRLLAFAVPLLRLREAGAGTRYCHNQGEPGRNRAGLPAPARFRGRVRLPRSPEGAEACSPPSEASRALDVEEQG